MHNQLVINMYKFQDKTYPNLPLMLEILGLDAGSGVPEGAEYQHDTIPAHDPATQYVTWQREVGGNWSMVIVDRPLFARVVDGIVVDLNPAAAYDGIPIDKLGAAQIDEADLWHDVPVNMRRHIRVGWIQNGDTFAPPSLAHLQNDLKNGAVEMGEEARQQIANPVGFNEVGMWLMNYVGVALHQAGLPTPMWDAALQIEATTKGIDAADLKATHIAKAQNYHAISALTQGLAGAAKTAFADSGADVDALIAEADVLRMQARSALADPQAAIAELLQQ